MTAQDIIAWLNGHVARTAHLGLDSRQLHAGDVFFACPGRAGDGRDYVQQAVEQGASAIVFEAGSPVPAMPIPCLEVPALSGQLGLIGHLWYGEPSLALSVVAVTGTNGKTTCVQWLAAALNAEGVPCGTVGTLGVTLPDGSNLGGALTTPDVLTMHRSLALMRDAGAAIVALEASSIGIHQGRLDHVHIEIAAFTNLTHDHLDYHGTLQDYKAAKFALFDSPGLRAAVINADDPSGRELLQSVPLINTLSYSLGAVQTADLQAHDIQTGSYGVVFNLQTSEGQAQLLTRLIGEHNVSNLLLVAGVLQELGWGLPKIARVLGVLPSVEGRLQVVDAVRNDDASACAMVVVDFAHTPDALERALIALRGLAAARGGRLVCLFGCGGSRDSGKRPIMGKIAATLADSVILTNDNPRGEDPLEIIGQIASGVAPAPRIEPDRALAIMSAIWAADAADVVLLAGKGHETYQEAKGVRTPFDDREWARFALSWKRGQTLSTDSRHIKSGQVFAAIKGDAFDGHTYLPQVLEAGAFAAIVEQRDASVAALPQFVLGDTRAALIRISTAWRRLFTLPLVGVTGSNGKTTTKEMIASIFRAWLTPDASLATQGNLNNDLGVPLTILRLSDQHRAAVVELGMNHQGEIALLSGIAQPTVALVNNAQREHQEFMHTVEAVAMENGSVIQALPQDGVAVFPGDDEYTGLWTSLAGERRIMDFGFESRFAVHADQIHAEPTRTLCRLHTPMGTASLTLSVPGLHNLRNALAATACACAAGATVASIVQGLEAFNPVSGRMQPRPLAGGFQLIDDTYNANPDSVRAAIDVLAQLPGKTVLVLGDMAEVGANSHAMHAEVGAYAQEKAIDGLLAFGPACVHAAAAFGPTGRAFETIDELTHHLITLLPANILVKGSRSTRMERVVRALETQLTNQNEETRHAT